MKRFLSLTLIAIMLLSTIALSSCSFINKLLGKERTTISEMEWRKAFMTKNYTMNMESEDMSIKIAASENGIDLNYLGLNIIIDPKTGYVIAESNGVYSGANIGSQIFFGADFSLGSLGVIPQLNFEDLTYDEDAGTYTYDDENTAYEFRFIDGQLSYALMVPSDPSQSGKMEITNIGTTNVSIPEYIDLTDGKIEGNKADASAVTTVTEEQLQAAFDFPNLTLTANILVGEMVVKTDEDSMSAKTTMMGMSEEVYLVKIDGVIHTIEKDYMNGGYVASPADEDDDILGSIGSGELEFTLDDLTYNQAGRYYEFEKDDVKYYFYFANGQLTQIVMIGDAMGMGVEMEIICNVSDVGTTSVDLPPYTILVPELDYYLNDDGTGYVVSGLGTYNSKDVVIPETYNGLPVTEIGSYAFLHDDIRSVTIPNSIVKIGDCAFMHCENLVTMYIPESVLYMGMTVFYGCDNLTVYSAFASRPDGWDSEWNLSANSHSALTIPVVWEGTAPVDPHMVTEEFWNRNMDMTNYTIDMYNVNGVMGVIAQTDDALIICLYENNAEYIEYAVKMEDGTVYYVYVDNYEWVGEYMDYYPNWVDLYDFEFDKEYYSYDADRQAYVSLNGSFEIVVYFENNVLVTVEVNLLSGENQLTMDFKHIGTTEEIEVPEFIIIG